MSPALAYARGLVQFFGGAGYLLPFGGQWYPCVVEDGRVLWLCGDHYRKYRERELAR